MDVILIGSFELFPSERMLCAAGKPVDLGARAFDLLLVLVEHQGRLVTKSTLLERVWPRLVVDENNLPAQIASLRLILGAGAIRTVPGFGYRLELSVSSPAIAEQASAPIAAPPAVPETPRLSVPRRAWPNRLGPLIGREADLRDIQQAIAQAPLVTIVGGAGVGKTRVAQEILALESEKSGAGVAWVPRGHSPRRDISRQSRTLGISLRTESMGSWPASGIGEMRCADTGRRGTIRRRARDSPGRAVFTQGVRARSRPVPLGVPSETVYRLSALRSRIAAPATGCRTICGGEVIHRKGRCGRPAIRTIERQRADCRRDLPAAGWKSAGTRTRSCTRSGAGHRRLA